ncbi:DNA polymerase alpha subunit B [Trichonephila clavipes]|nr:DNA polymerase alpha subunit B [Trichonephila clavipes]
MDPASQVGTAQGLGGSIMVWGVFCVALFVIFGACTNLHAIRYANLLGNHLHLFMFSYYPHGNGVFLQDNCTSLKSWLATGWLEEHTSDFFLFPHFFVLPHSSLGLALRFLKNSTP